MNFFLFILLSLSFIFLVRADEGLDGELGIAVMSDTGKKILETYQVGGVATYRSGDAKLYGLSGNPDGKIIGLWKPLSKIQLEKIKQLLLEDANFQYIYGGSVKGEINLDQGVEITNGEGFLRVYFTKNGEYCKFFSSSGKSSLVWRCSPSLKKYGAELMKRVSKTRGQQN